MTNVNVLVSGAGIAGMTLATLLSRIGYRVTVVERAPAIRSTGYSIDFRGRAMDVLEGLGVLDQARSLTTQMRGTTVVDADGTPVERLPAEEFGGDLEVPKRDFSALLYRHAADVADFVLDDTITGLRQEDDGVRVAFERRPEQTFVLVFGADGTYSRVRRLAFGPHADAIHHLGMSGAGFSADNFLSLDHEGLLRSMPGAAIYLFSGRDPERLTVSLSFGTASPDLDRRPRVEQETAVRKAFAGSGWETPRLLAAMGRAEDFYFSSACQVRLDSWSRGRVVLVGDAGYCAAPTSGMGASQALLGARSLVGRLAAAGGDHRTAFADYEAELRTYVTQNQEIGRAGAAAFGGMTEA